MRRGLNCAALLVVVAGGETGGESGDGRKPFERELDEALATMLDLWLAMVSGLERGA